MNKQKNGAGAASATPSVAPVVARLHAYSDANEAVAAVRKLIEQQPQEQRAQLGEAFERHVTAVEAVYDQLQSELRAAREAAKQGSAPAGTPVATKLIQFRVKRGSKESQSRDKLAELVRTVAPQNLASALAYEYFCTTGTAERLATDLLAEIEAGKS